MADTINLQEYFETPLSRRSALRQLGALAGVSLALNACSTPPSTNPVQGPTASGPGIPYYYALADSFPLCGNYFCYQLGPTLPNRIALWTGTTGGFTRNHRIPRGILTWPTIIDLLDDHNISWKCYNLGTGMGSTPEVEFINALPFFKRWFKDKRLYYRETDYYNDLKEGSLPQVTYLISDAFSSEHPPLNIVSGE